MFSCAFICSELVLKPSPLYEDSIDTTYEQICQKMWEQLANGHPERHPDRQTDGQTDACFNNIDKSFDIGFIGNRALLIASFSDDLDMYKHLGI